MTFNGKAQRESVYDPESDTFIAEFQNGVFETKDESVIAKLIKLGYEAVGEKAAPEEKPKRGRPKK